MKKVIFILTVFMTLFLMSDTMLAKTETEYEKAIRYYNTGKYREAVEIFKDYIQTKPEAPAFYRIGYALYELREYDEAQKYFQQAYLIDPSFSPEIVTPIIKGKKISKPSITQVPSKQEPQVPAAIEPQPETPPTAIPEPQLQMQMEPQKPQEQVVTPEQEAPPEETQVVTPQRVQPPVAFPEFPMPEEGMPTKIPGIGPGLMAGLGILALVFEILGLLAYIFFCYCVFRIAKKLDIPAPWLAFIPIINIWIIVSCAGKPWWWILLLFIPFINIIVGIILWMSITENLGRNKWLGLLMIVPVINFIFLAMLAFSKTEQIGTTEGITTV